MRKTIEVINELKDKGLIKDYAIGGAIGVLRWVEPFFTRDLDLFVVLNEEMQSKQLINLSPLYDYLKNRGHGRWTGQWVIIEGLPTEFIPADELGKEAVENAEVTEFEGVDTKVIIPEYLIALLVRSGRDKDIRKIQMLLEQAQVDRKRVEEILEKYNLYDKFANIVGRQNG